MGDLDGDAVGGDEEVTYEVWSMKYSSLFVFPGGVTQISRRRPGIRELRRGLIQDLWFMKVGFGC